MAKSREHNEAFPRRAAKGNPAAGLAPVGVALLLVILAACAGYLLLGSEESNRSVGAGPVVISSAQKTSQQERFTAPTLALNERTTAASQTSAVDRFKGRGSLRGTVDTSIGGQFPATWSLIIEPSRAIGGSQQATARRFEYTQDERDFEVLNLPLAGYSIRAEAPGFNGLGTQVLLERTSSSAYIMLQLSPAGFVAGQLVDSEGAPLEGIEVWIFHGQTPPLGQSGSGGRQTITLPDGTWRFERVLNGPHSLVFGTPISPLVPPQSINFRAPSLTVPSPKLPKLSNLKIMVTDQFQVPITGAIVHGSGSSGGNFDLETSPTGLVQLRHLTPGRYRFTINHELYAEGRLDRRFTGGEDEIEVVVLGEIR